MGAVEGVGTVGGVTAVGSARSGEVLVEVGGVGSIGVEGVGTVTSFTSLTIPSMDGVCVGVGSVGGMSMGTLAAA